MYSMKNTFNKNRSNYYQNKKKFLRAFLYVMNHFNTQQRLKIMILVKSYMLTIIQIKTEHYIMILLFIKLRKKTMIQILDMKQFQKK